MWESNLEIIIFLVAFVFMSYSRNYAKPNVVKISHMSSSRSFIILGVLLGHWCILS